MSLSIRISSSFVGTHLGVLKDAPRIYGAVPGNLCVAAPSTAPESDASGGSIVSSAALGGRLLLSYPIMRHSHIN
jgi:hypothetical protein